MEKKYIETEKVEEEIIKPYYHAMFIISETLVEESKIHISSEDAIRKIRNELCKLPSNLNSRMGIEKMLEEISVTEKEIAKKYNSSIEIENTYNSYLDRIEDDCKKLNKDLEDDLF